MWLASKSIAERYNKIVNDCLENEDVFSGFKSNPDYNSIVGMSKVWQADIWIKDIYENHPEVISLLPKIMKNDIYGRPDNWAYEKDIVLSPNTARYINSSLQIIDYFKYTAPINVSELGVGYGGLCYVMNCLLKINEYGLIDLPNVQNLAKKYLNLLDVHNIVFEQPKNNDLFISEFCLSEFDDEQLYEFYYKHVLTSKNIFLQMNLHEEDRKSKFLKTIENDFNCVVRDEFPKTHWPNYTVLGTRK